MQFTRKNIQLSSTNLSYLESQPGKEDCLIYLHGFRGNSDVSVDFASYFKPYRTLLIDIPGYGNSPSLNEPHTMRSLSRVINNFIELTAPNQKVYLVGHSFGGALAYSTVHFYPHLIQRTALITPALVADGAFIQAARSYYRLYATLPTSMQQSLQRNYPLVRIISQLLLKTDDTAIRKRYLKTAYECSQFINPKTVAEASLDMSKRNFIEWAPKINTPSLLLAGERDTFTRPQTIKKLSDSMPSAQFQLIRQTGHLAPLEKPKEVAEYINEFFVS